jgi:hypothetical protein
MKKLMSFLCKKYSVRKSALHPTNCLPFSHIAFGPVPKRKFLFALSATSIFSSFVSTSSNEKICENRKGQANSKLAVPPRRFPFLAESASRHRHKIAADK